VLGRLSMSVLLSIKNNDFELALKLIESYADCTELDEYGNSALMIAISNGNIPIIKALIKRGVKLDVVDYLGFSCVDKAIRSKNFKVIRLVSKSCLGLDKNSFLDKLKDTNNHQSINHLNSIGYFK